MANKRAASANRKNAASNRNASGSASANMFCKRAHLVNEASVENWFVDKLLAHLGYTADDIRLKTAIRELKIGQGSGSSLYRPDYVILVNGFPTLIIDAKSPDENISSWTTQCGSYCLELNRLYEHNPVEYYILTNGLSTNLYKWDRAKPLAELSFDDFQDGNSALKELEALISKQNIGRLANAKRDELMESDFPLEPITLEEMSAIFARLHQFIWEVEKRPQAPHSRS